MTGCRLSYFDRNKIERAIDQAAEARPVLPVSVHVEYEGRTFRVLVTPVLDKEKVYRARAQAGR